MNKNMYTRIAMVVSLCLVIIWGLLGTGTSLAWFVDTDKEVNNIFHFAEFDVEVEYRDKNGNWKTIEGDTNIFNKDAFYEPGYTEVVYLRVINKGTVPFDFKTAVSVTDYTVATNVFGQPFHLQDYLLFGLTTAQTEAELYEMMATRDLADEVAIMPLCNYASETAELDAGDTVYMALIVRMPKHVGNVANYRGDVIPRVELGLIVTATQQTD